MTAPTTDALASAERRIQELTKELSLVRGEVAEGRDQHAATAGILAALSSSPADLRRVCAEIAANAARLCDAYDATIFQVDGDILRRVANYGSIPTNDTLPLTREIVTGRAVFDKQIIHIVDLQAGSEEYPAGRDIALRFGLRTVLAVPLMRASAAIGVVMIRRREVRQFSEKQISLLRTFADQAVIAIENTRLFEAEQARTRELSEALEQQTATGEILGVISRSPTALQPVLDTLVKSATRFCGADDVTIFRLQGDDLVFVAHHGPLGFPGASSLSNQQGLIVPVVRGTTTGRSLIERRVIHIADLQTETEEFPEGSAFARKFDYRAILSAPLLRHGSPLGAIVLRRREAKLFTDKQVELVTTFADQAVIAIENTRLFEEVQARTHELQVALEQQTATTDVLQVISSSPGELQPVFDGILANVTRVCGAHFGHLCLCEGEDLRNVAIFGAPPEFVALRRGIPALRPAPNSVLDRVVTTKQPQHILDFRDEQTYLNRLPNSVQLAGLPAYGQC